MSTFRLRVSGAAVAALAALGVSAASCAQPAEATVTILPGPAAPGPQVLDESIPLTSDVNVDVEMWISEPFANGSGSLRFVVLRADYNVKRVSINKGLFYGPIDAQGAEELNVGSGTVSIGIAKMLARQILGQPSDDEFVPERVGPFHGSVRPVEGKTWAAVSSAADLELTFKAE
jgi:opacity protein-like surface antigen